MTDQLTTGTPTHIEAFEPRHVPSSRLRPFAQWRRRTGPSTRPTSSRTGRANMRLTSRRSRSCAPAAATRCLLPAKRRRQVAPKGCTQR